MTNRINGLRCSHIMEHHRPEKEGSSSFHAGVQWLPQCREWTEQWTKEQADENSNNERKHEDTRHEAVLPKTQCDSIKCEA